MTNAHSDICKAFHDASDIESKGQQINTMSETQHSELVSFIWKNADDLWGNFKHVDFGKVILPFTLLRRLECVLHPTREQVRAAHKNMAGEGIDLDPVLRTISGYSFYNTSNYDLASLGATRTRVNLEDYIAQFSANARTIFEQFDFANTIARMDKAGVLYTICQNFAKIDLHPERVPERAMSNVYEHLIRRFGAEVNEAAEDFMTPRDVVHLMVELLLHPDDEMFVESPGLIRTLYDPTSGTGGLLSDGMEHAASLRDRRGAAPVIVPYGQELEPETHAVCLAGMLLKTDESDPGRDLSKNIALGSTLSNDLHADARFNYGISNPPFGKKWELDQKAVQREHAEKKFEGRFGPKLPRVSDGSMLFLLHLVSKLEAPERGGGRATIVLSGSPLFNGGAGSGESEIRRHLLESDVVEAIVALPQEIFFRTGIGTYVWLLSNRKPPERKGKVQLIDATKMFEPMRKSEGNKRRRVSDENAADILRLYADFEEGKTSRIFPASAFGYRRVKVLRPLRHKIVISPDGVAALGDEKAWMKRTDEQREAWLDTLLEEDGIEHDWDWIERFAKAAAKRDADLGKADVALIKAFRAAFGVRDPEGEPVRDKKGALVPDDGLTDYETVPMGTDIEEYMAHEVLPHAPDAWVDDTYRDTLPESGADGGVGVVGYEINFNRYFYEYVPPRPLDEIDAELKASEARIAAMLAEVAG